MKSLLLLFAFACVADAGFIARTVPHSWATVDTTNIYGGLYKVSDNNITDARDLPCFKGIDPVISADLCVDGLPNKDTCVGLNLNFGSHKTHCTIGSGKTGAALNFESHEFRFRRFSYEHDETMVKCAVKRTANTYLTELRVAIKAHMHHNLFESWAEVESCSAHPLEEVQSSGKNNLVAQDTFILDIELQQGGPGFMWGVSDYVWYAVLVLLSCCCFWVCACSWGCRRMCMIAIRERERRWEQLLEEEEAAVEEGRPGPLGRVRSERMKKALSQKYGKQLKKVTSKMPAIVTESGWNNPAVLERSATNRSSRMLATDGYENMDDVGSGHSARPLSRSATSSAAIRASQSMREPPPVDDELSYSDEEGGGVAISRPHPAAAAAAAAGNRRKSSQSGPLPRGKSFTESKERVPAGGVPTVFHEAEHNTPRRSVPASPRTSRARPGSAAAEYQAMLNDEDGSKASVLRKQRSELLDEK